MSLTPSIHHHLTCHADKVWGSFDVHTLDTTLCTSVAGGFFQHCLVIIVTSCTWCFMQDLEASYKASNPYHNSTHAADVVQGLASLFAQNSFMAAAHRPGDALHDPVLCYA